jgi:putative hydrolase of the HAD superfamily
MIDTPTHLIFDLDNTLYPREAGLFPLINARINQYMHEVLAINPGEVELLRKKYLKKYGITLAGLIRHHDVDPDDYLDFVHEVPVEKCLSKNRELSEIIAAAGCHKCIFTNGSLKHSQRVLRFMEIEHYFSEIFDIKFMGYRAKPALESYRKVLDVLGAEPENCLIFEDLPTNLEPARQMGMTTVLVGNKDGRHFDYNIENINDIRRIFNELGILDG